MSRSTFTVYSQPGALYDLLLLELKLAPGGGELVWNEQLGMGMPTFQGNTDESTGIIQFNFTDTLVTQADAQAVMDAHDPNPFATAVNAATDLAGLKAVLVRFMPQHVNDYQRGIWHNTPFINNP